MLTTDQIIERNRLKQSARKWRMIGIFTIILALFLFVSKSADNILAGTSAGKEYIARVEIDGLITHEPEKIKRLKKLAENEDVKAVVLFINSPGGTTMGGEVLHNSFTNIAKEKPLVAVMGNLAASAGYMIALPAEHIIAHKATITGSIGVVMELPQVKGLADNWGIKLNKIASGGQKGEPSPMRDMSADTEKVIESIIMDFHDEFTKMVAEGRSMNLIEVQKLADGRAYSAKQALDLGLIDAIGTEQAATDWLKEKKELDHDVVDYKLEAKRGFFGEMKSMFNGAKQSLGFSNSGLMSKISF